MNKKFLSMLLTFVMVFNLAIPPIAFAAPLTGDYEMKLVGTASTVEVKDVETDAVTGTRDALQVDVQMRGANINAVQNLYISYDPGKVELVGWNDGQVVTLNSNYSSPLQSEGGQAILNSRFTAAANVYGKVEDDGRVYLKLEPNVSNRTNDTLAYLVRFKLAFKENVSIADLDATTLMLASPEMAKKNNMRTVAAMTNYSNVAYNYGTVSGEVGSLYVDLESDTLPKPTIEYPGSDVMNLKGVKVDATNRYVNVPVSLPNAGTDVTVQATATGYYRENCEMGSEIPAADVDFTYSVAMKDGSTLPETVAIDANTGVLTVKAGAPAAVVTVTAEGSYTNTKNQVSTASGTFDIELCHGDAGKKETDDPTEPEKQPGGDPDPAPADLEKLAGVEIYCNKEGKDVKVASSASETPYEHAIAIPADGNAATEVTFVAKELNMYGDALTGAATGAWSYQLNGTDCSTSTNPAFTDGKIAVSPGATTGTYDMAYKADTYTATVAVTVDTNAINWPTFSTTNLVYGQKLSALQINNDGSATTEAGTVADPTFEWVNGDTLPNAGTQTVTMVCKDGETQLGTKDFSIIVDKANQKIVIDPNIVLEGENAKTLNLSKGDVVDLKATAVNASVPDENGEYTIATAIDVNYNLQDANSLVSMDNTTHMITGEKESASNSDVATLTLTAESNSNYNAADEFEMQIYVQKPVLKATITFDTEAPEFGKAITATITEADGQAGSLTADVTYLWGHMVSEGDGEKFEAFGAAANLTNAVNGKTTLTYTPGENDVNKTLALQVNTPKNNSDYKWIDGVQEKMAAAVAKATPTDPEITVSNVTYNSITVDPIEGAQYAIQKKSETGDPTWSTVGVANANVFTGLDANTEYTISVKLGETNTHKASNIVTEDQTTKQKTVTPTPNPGGDPDPIPADITGVTVTAAITEPANGLKFNETLTASVTVDSTNASETVTINDSDWDYQWIRVTPGENGAADTEEVISGATGTSYVLAEGDIGKVIKVKATTKATCEYAATAEDTTSGAIAKADGPTLVADGIVATETSAADAKDGAITIAAPADLTKDYEYRLKAAEGATENAWTDATITDGKLADNLGIGTYEIRIKGTNTVEPSNTIEVEVKSAGHDIIGTVTSYNAKNAITYALYAWDDAINDYSETVSSTGTAVPAADTTGSGKETKSFTISGVANGKYKLVLSKTSHLDFTVKNIVVNNKNFDLTQDSRDLVRSISMGCGDLTGDGMIDYSDQNVILAPECYNKAIAEAGEAYNYVDLNGEGMVDYNDQNIVLDPACYNKNTLDFTVE